ncbi:MAG: DUF4157 domain-containing protein, partial [Rhodospirillales bacterium]|nr:DUF4157 domain-containing protein [Rhodospirillales bacterium]
MKTFATQEKRPAPAARKARPYVHHPMGPVQRAQQAEIRRILRSTGAQAKLTIGQPNDKYEQEADRVADRVTAMPDPRLQRQPEAEEEEETLQAKPLADQITPLVQRQEEPPEEEEEEPVQAKFKVGEMIQRMCPECDGETAQRQPMKEEEEELQTKTKPGETPAVTPGLASTINGLKGGGQPLDSATRAFFEPRFGRDFGHVRLHTDSEAAETASSINARAYTLGNHIALEAGEYQPNSRSGQRLLGHELTHVIQQGKGRKSVGDQFRKSYRTAPVDRVDSGQIIRRDLLEDLRRMAEEAGKARLRELADQPVGPGGWTGADPGCHAKFCRPFASLPRAVADLAWAGPLILAGIATKVNSRVVPLWARYISGGSGVQNLSGR